MIESCLDKRLERAITLFKKSYVGDISEVGQKELNCLLEDKTLLSVLEDYITHYDLPFRRLPVVLTFPD